VKSLEDRINFGSRLYIYCSFTSNLNREEKHQILVVQKGIALLQFIVKMGARATVACFLLVLLLLENPISAGVFPYIRVVGNRFWE
jgi:hypothetical protein